MSKLLPTPPIGTNTLSPRIYQAEAIDAAREKLRNHRSTLIVLPTGTGKTCVFAMASRMCAEKGGRTLILAHREELINQAASVLERVGLAPGIERAESYARSLYNPHSVVATVQTLRGKRLESWPRDYFKLIVVDEAHHSTAQSYRNILDYFRAAKVVGVTATPDRADEDEIADVFESTAYEMSIWDAMTAPAPGPYLAPLKFVRCDTPIDLRGLKSSSDDYNESDLADRITPLVEVLANAVKARVGDRQTLVFTPDCASASAMATALQSIDCKADFVWGDSPDRTDKIERYKRGETRILVNCMIFTEGFDAPYTSAIVLCRPTKSRSLYSQMVGRGTRLAPGKSDCIVVDFAWLTDAHDLVRPADLVISRSRDDESDAADILDSLTDADEEVDLIEAAKKAKDEGTKRRALKIEAKAREDKLKWTQLDPLSGVFGMLGVPVVGSIYEATHDRPSRGLVEALLKFKVPSPDKLSKRNAKALMNALCERADAGLSSQGQIRVLVKNGVPIEQARDMTKSEASARIDEIACKNGWAKKPRPEFQLRQGA
jgi:superfamily II DNA or RNA helicase